MSNISEILKSYNLTESQINDFCVYYGELVRWNEKINLTSITEPFDVCTKHFIDSVSPISEGIISDNASIIDVGCGAGFPGMCLKIYNKSLDVTLMDSLNKRLIFLDELINKLNLKGIRCVHKRAEEAGRDKKMREKFDYATSRAVANLTSLTELCLPLVKVGGYFIALKGPKADEEIENAKKAISLLGGKIEKVHEYKVKGTDLNHNLVIIKKERPTPNTYPRKAPKPIKEPLV